MKNIPIFTAVNGTASLILQEIPISGKAYVILRSVWTTAEALLTPELQARLSERRRCSPPMARNPCRRRTPTI